MTERDNQQAVELEIHCDKNGISVRGARNIGSTCDTAASSKSNFLRICENWWNTYVRGYCRMEEIFEAEEGKRRNSRNAEQ